MSSVVLMLKKPEMVSLSTDYEEFSKLGNLFMHFEELLIDTLSDKRVYFVSVINDNTLECDFEIINFMDKVYNEEHEKEYQDFYLMAEYPTLRNLIDFFKEQIITIKKNGLTYLLISLTY